MESEITIPQEVLNVIFNDTMKLHHNLKAGKDYIEGRKHQYRADQQAMREVAEKAIDICICQSEISKVDRTQTLNEGFKAEILNTLFPPNF